MQILTDRRDLVVLVLLSLLSVGGMLFTLAADAAIYRWDNGELITDKDAVPGAYCDDMDLSYANLVGTSLFSSKFEESDLTHAHLMGADLRDTFFHGATLTNADLRGSNLIGADFERAYLTDADFSGAVVSQAFFEDTTGTGFTATQLYSTASYQSGDLSGIELCDNDLRGWHFTGKNLTDADFEDAH